ncbi:branched-chain amino acid aminotransferase [Hydrocarboniphaga daqingensis]|jgi:branched-chain amino acid aminotransferase|uniref:Branched-chain-amino-acid aminotransferase n=1 Tax=Hydrocarboniphaga daqingensis TaxID=490188 RepID=A0A1M5S8U4_9GAMM|nr:branched-chain amino acid transaminase [Hydrocarboniphaga daqingensis]SHH34909.1 branched-chain amino acid aminotransferase [Hydrocarboniphaga daqingensis]
MSMSDRDGYIWYDGKMVPWREATTHVLTYTLHYGAGCFEGVRAYETPKGTAIFRLQEHTRRLFNSAKIIGMAMPWSEDELNEAQLEVLRVNQLKEAYLRPMVFYGSEGMGLRATGLKTHVIVAAWTWGSYLGADGMERGIRVKTSSFSRHYVNSSLCRAKANANYLNSSMALNEVLKDGYDEALMLDPEGYVAEGSAENIFVITNGVISTPDVTSALDGITRRTVMQLAQDMGYTVRERRITRDEVYVCDEAFFTGTAAEVTPIREIDNRPVGSGSRGPITQKLQAAYLAQVKGQSERYPEWLSHI